MKALNLFDKEYNCSDTRIDIISSRYFKIKHNSEYIIEWLSKLMLSLYNYLVTRVRRRRVIVVSLCMCKWVCVFLA